MKPSNVYAMLVVCILVIAAFAVLQTYSLQHAQTDLSASNAQVQGLQQQVSSLTQQLGTLNQQVGSLNQQVSSLTASRDSLQSQLSASQNTVQSQAAIIANQTSQIAALQNQLLGLNGTISSLRSQLLNATALIALLQGPTGILPTSMRLTYHLDGYSDFELSLKNTGDVNITQIFIVLDAMPLSMQFFFLNMTVNPQSPLPPYQIATGSYSHLALSGGKGTYTLIISAVAVNGSVYSYQTTVSNL